MRSTSFHFPYWLFKKEIQKKEKEKNKSITGEWEMVYGKWLFKEKVWTEKKVTGKKEL